MRSLPVLLVIGYVWPEPNSSAAGNRMMQLVLLFKRVNYHIVFASAAQKSGFESDLTALGIEEKTIQLNHSSFDDFIAILQPQVVLFDRYFMEEQFAWRISKICPNALKILDTEDLHFLRYARHQAWKENREVEISDLQSDYAKREIASILRCDCTLIISKYEMDLLQNTFKIDPKLLFYFPLLMHASITDIPSFENRKDFVFIGNFWHEPNWQALRYLKDSIWPILAKIVPHASLQIYGAYASQKVMQLHNPKQRFLVKGRAGDASQIMRQARVCLAPLQFGAGLKGKLLEAMQNGTPSVTTWIGAEGIANEKDWPGFIANTPEMIAQAAAQLYNEVETWQESQKKGFDCLNSEFKAALFETTFIAHLNELRQHLTRYRQANFMGAILQYHTMASTEYMSRWIELKTKYE
jgi:glycosyltransferase involved in cell wall biosynthesis